MVGRQVEELEIARMGVVNYVNANAGLIGTGMATAGANAVALTSYISTLSSNSYTSSSSTTSPLPTLIHTNQLLKFFPRLINLSLDSSRSLHRSFSRSVLSFTPSLAVYLAPSLLTASIALPSLSSPAWGDLLRSHTGLKKLLMHTSLGGRKVAEGRLRGHEEAIGAIVDSGREDCEVKYMGWGIEELKQWKKEAEREAIFDSGGWNGERDDGVEGPDKNKESATVRALRDEKVVGIVCELLMKERIRSFRGLYAEESASQSYSDQLMTISECLKTVPRLSMVSKLWKKAVKPYGGEYLGFTDREGLLNFADWMRRVTSVKVGKKDKLKGLKYLVLPNFDSTRFEGEWRRDKIWFEGILDLMKMIGESDARLVGIVLPVFLDMGKKEVRKMFEILRQGRAYKSLKELRINGSINSHNYRKRGEFELFFKDCLNGYLGVKNQIERISIEGIFDRVVIGDNSIGGIGLERGNRVVRSKLKSISFDKASCQSVLEILELGIWNCLTELELSFWDSVELDDLGMILEHLGERLKILGLEFLDLGNQNNFGVHRVGRWRGNARRMLPHPWNGEPLDNPDQLVAYLGSIQYLKLYNRRFSHASLNYFPESTRKTLQSLHLSTNPRFLSISVLRSFISSHSNLESIDILPGSDSRAYQKRLSELEVGLKDGYARSGEIGRLADMCWEKSVKLNFGGWGTDELRDWWWGKEEEIEMGLGLIQDTKIIENAEEQK